MTLIVNSQLFTSENITNKEFIELYIMVGGWYAFFIWNKLDAREYVINAILDVIGRNVNIVTLEKERLFTKLEKIIQMTYNNIPYKEENGITKHSLIEYDIFLTFEGNFLKYNIKFEDFENKYRFDDYENLNLPEVQLNIEEKVRDLEIFSIAHDRTNIAAQHQFLVGNLRKLYFERAKVLHPDKGGNSSNFQNLSNTYEKLMALRKRDK